MVKILSRGKFSKLIMNINKNPTANIIFNGEKHDALLSPISATRQRCPISPFLFSVILEVLAAAIRQEK
jgi:hypothetical protein